MRAACLLCVLTAAAGVPAGEVERWSGIADAVFQHFNVDQGLPQTTATVMAEDGDGFLWVGTQGGLARWDGYRFRNYLPDPKNPGALTDNFINALHADPSGRLWVGMSTGGLARYDRDNDRFSIYAAGSGGLSAPDVSARVKVVVASVMQPTAVYLRQLWPSQRPSRARG